MVWCVRLPSGWSRSQQSRRLPLAAPGIPSLPRCTSASKPRTGLPCVVSAQVFDVVRSQGGLADAPAAAVANPFSGLGAASSVPGSFRTALAKLSACLVLSASGNALVSYCSTLLGERFAHRLKGQLMEVRGLVGGRGAAQPGHVWGHVVSGTQVPAASGACSIRQREGMPATPHSPPSPPFLLLQTIIARPQAFFDSTPKGDLVARLTLDVQVLQATLAGGQGRGDASKPRHSLPRPPAATLTAAMRPRRLLPLAPQVLSLSSVNRRTHMIFPTPPPPPADFIGQRGFRSMFEVTGALALIAVQQPLLALVSLAITPLLSRLLRSVVVRSSAIIYRRQQVGWAHAHVHGFVNGCEVFRRALACVVGRAARAAAPNLSFHASPLSPGGC